jgi:hypothetical protein
VDSAKLSLQNGRWPNAYAVADWIAIINAPQPPVSKIQPTAIRRQHLIVATLRWGVAKHGRGRKRINVAAYQRHDNVREEQTARPTHRQSRSPVTRIHWFLDYMIVL